MGHGRCRLHRDRRAPGTARLLPRTEHQDRPGRLLPPQCLPKPCNRMGGNRAPGHGTARFHHQAHLLFRTQEEVQGALRQDRGLGTLRRRLRHHEGQPDGQAAGVQNRRRLVLIQPGRQPRPDVEGQKRPRSLVETPTPGFTEQGTTRGGLQQLPLVFSATAGPRPEKVNRRGKGQYEAPRNPRE